MKKRILLMAFVVTVIGWTSMAVYLRMAHEEFTTIPTWAKVEEFRFAGQDYHLVGPKQVNKHTKLLLFSYATGITDVEKLEKIRWFKAYDPVFFKLAKANYVTLAPKLRHSNDGTVMKKALSEIESILAMAYPKESPQKVRQMTADIGVFGHSQGGGTSILLSNHPRIKAAAAIEPDCWNHIKFEQCIKATQSSTPILLMAGGGDHFVPECSIHDVALQAGSSPVSLVSHSDLDHINWMMGFLSDSHYGYHKAVSLQVKLWMDHHLRQKPLLAGVFQKPLELVGCTVKERAFLQKISREYHLRYKKVSH